MKPVPEEDIEVREDGKEYNKRTGNRVYRVREERPDNHAARRRREKLAAKKSRPEVKK